MIILKYVTQHTERMLQAGDLHRSPYALNLVQQDRMINRGEMACTISDA